MDEPRSLRENKLPENNELTRPSQMRDDSYNPHVAQSPGKRILNDGLMIDNLQAQIKAKDTFIEELKAINADLIDTGRIINQQLLTANRETDAVRGQLNKQHELYLLTLENKKVAETQAQLLEKILKTIIDSFAGRAAL